MGALLAPTGGAQARKVDLSALAGKYKGAMVVEAVGMQFPGTVAVRFKAAPSGLTAKVTISGVIQSTSPIAFGALVSLLQGHKCKVTNVVIGNPVPMSPGIGTYQQKSLTRVVGSADVVIGTNTMTFICDLAVKPSGKKRKVIGKLTVLLDGVTYAEFHITATGRK
jgi:hypothetical protein